MSENPTASDSGTTLGRRERRKHETREALETAALRLFLQRGFDETTIEDITEVADVARRTFFRYFDSKEAVLFARQEDQIALLTSELNARPADEPILTGIRAALHALARTQSDRSEHQLVLARIALNAPTVAAHAAHAQRRWEEAVQDWITHRLDATPDDLRPAVLAGATVAALRAALAQWVAGGGLENPADLLERALTVLQRDLVTPDPRT